MESESSVFSTYPFQNFNLLVPIGSSNEEENKKFIIPCMLPPKLSNMYEMEPFRTMVLAYHSEHTTKSREPFQIGTFHQLLSQCSKIWKICSEDHLSYTDASFQIKENVRLALTSLDRQKIRVSLWCSRDAIEPFTHNLIQAIRTGLGKMFTKLGLGSDNKYLLLCPHWSIDDVNPCLVPVTEMQESSSIQPADQVCVQHQKADT